MILPNVTQTLTGNAKTGTSIRVLFLCFQRFKETRSLHFHKMYSKGIGEISPTSPFAEIREWSISVMICPACARELYPLNIKMMINLILFEVGTIIYRRIIMHIETQWR